MVPVTQSTAAMLRDESWLYGFVARTFRSAARAWSFSSGRPMVMRTHVS
jgi:hypothetical protein